MGGGASIGATGGTASPGGTGGLGASGSGIDFSCGPPPDLVELFEKYCITCACDENGAQVCEQCDVTCDFPDGSWGDVGTGAMQPDGCTVCSCTATGLECNSSACPNPKPPPVIPTN